MIEKLKSIGNPTRLGLVLAGDRLVAALISRQKTEVFVVEAEQPAATLRAELDARHVRTRAVAVGLLRTSVTVKPIELPAVGGALRDMVKFELERHVPFPADDAPFDFVPLPASANGRGGNSAQRVLIAAADRRIVDSALRLAEEARLRTVSITLAAHDLVGLVRTRAGKRVVWVHHTGDTADLLFLVGGAIALSRSVPADETRIAEEIRRSFTVTRWPECDAIWLSGDVEAPGTPALTPLTDLGAPVTAPPYTPRAQHLLEGTDAGQRGIAELAIAVAAGRRGRPLDLLPDALRPRRLTRPQLITLGMAGLTLVLALGAFLVPGLRVKSHLAGVNASIDRLTPEVRAVEQVAQELESKRRLLGTIDSLDGGAVRPLPVLRELTELLPNDAWLTTISIDGKGIEVTGQAAAASGLIPLLENSPRFARVEFASPVTRGRDREQFRIRAAWETADAATARALTNGADAATSPPGAVTRPRTAPSPPGPPLSPGAPAVAPGPRGVPRPGVAHPPAGFMAPQAPSYTPGAQPRRPGGPNAPTQEGR